MKGTELQDTGDLEEGRGCPWNKGQAHGWVHSLFHWAEPQAQSCSAAGSGLKGEAFPKNNPLLTPSSCCAQETGLQCCCVPWSLCRAWMP